MKYALLVYQSQDYFDRRDDAAAMAAGNGLHEARLILESWMSVQLITLLQETPS